MTVSQAENYFAKALSRMMDIIVVDVIHLIAWDRDPFYAKFAEHQTRMPRLAHQTTILKWNRGWPVRSWPDCFWTKTWPLRCLIGTQAGTGPLWSTRSSLAMGLMLLLDFSCK